jgi:diacylglycerol kinase
MSTTRRRKAEGGKRKAEGGRRTDASPSQLSTLNSQLSDDRRRSAWKQRMREVERGMTLGFRRDCTFFVHFFVSSVVVAAGLVMGLSLVEWGMLVLSLTIVLTAEMFQQVLKTILDGLGHHFPDSARRAERIGGAGVFVAFVGTIITLSIIFTERLMVLFSG